MKSTSFHVLIPMICLAAAMPCRAELGFVLVLVQDAQNHPVRRVEIGIEGSGDSKLTDDHGKAQLAVGSATKEGDWLPLAIQHSPPWKDLVMNSPWDGRAQVPSFEDKPENFVRVVVVQRGDRAALENGSVLASLAAKINKANSPKSAKDQAPPLDPKVNLDAVAKQYGLAPDDVDKAIRAWGAKTADPYEAGLAALYERDYSKATAQLQDSLKQREEKLTADQKAIAQDQKQVADAASFLGLSLFKQGKYRESAQAYGGSLQIRPDDPGILNGAAESLEYAGDYTEAEPLFRRAVVIDEKVLGPDHPDMARDLNNLATLLYTEGDYAGAEPMLRRAVVIDEKALGPDHPTVAIDLSGLAKLLQAKGDYAGAEPLFRRALAIDGKALGLDNANVAVDLNNLAELLWMMVDYAKAEPLYRQALAIDEKVLGPDHPELATSLNNLAVLLENKKDYAGAEPLYRRALGIDEKVLGPDHPSLAIDLNNLAVLLQDKKDYVGAEPLYRRALAINEKALGPNHPEVAANLSNLAELLKAKGDNTGAEPLLRRALEIDTKALGPDHPTTRRIQGWLAPVLAAEKQKEK
jgi:tetratricopeptide (TPR) repeat protein